MNVGVCIKQVPPSDARIAVNNGVIDKSLFSKMIINPYDEFALEEAVRLKDKGIAERVFVFTLDNDKNANKQILAALARGADEAVWIQDPLAEQVDCLGAGRILAAAIKSKDISMVFCGKQSSDGDNAQLPNVLAELLDWPSVSSITKLEVDGDSFKAWSDIGSGSKGVFQGTGQVVFSCDKGLNEPRFVKLKERMAAKKKPLNVVSVSELDLDESVVAADSKFVHESNWSLPEKRGDCRFIEGTPQEAANELVSLLRSEAKVL